MKYIVGSTPSTKATLYYSLYYSNIYQYTYSISPSHYHTMSSKKQILYSDKYYDDQYEYRHVQVTPEIAKLVPRGHLMSETEWRAIGVQQSHGWIHYMIHEPEPHILLFRRPISSKPPTQEEQIKAEMEEMN